MDTFDRMCVATLIIFSVLVTIIIGIQHEAKLDKLEQKIQTLEKIVNGKTY